MSMLKITYARKRWFGILSPFFHSSFEINYNGKIKRMGFYEKFDALWPLSLLMPLPGEMRDETENGGSSFIMSRDGKKIKRVLELVHNKRYQWKVYHALFRNCFHWRNAILREAGIKYPTGDWF